MICVPFFTIESVFFFYILDESYDSFVDMRFWRVYFYLATAFCILVVSSGLYMAFIVPSTLSSEASVTVQWALVSADSSC